MFFTVSLRNKKSLAALMMVMILLVTGVTGATVDALGINRKFEGVPLTIVMYHGIVKDSRHQGTYMISPQLLESDMKYLKEKGYTAVVVQDLIDYVDNDKPLPEKPVMLTFDDGYYNNYLYAYPLSLKYNMKIVISPIGYFTQKYSESGEENELYSHITWTEINEMMQSGMVEIQNHSYHLHGTADTGRLGAQKNKRESIEAYTSLLTNDLTEMQELIRSHTGWTPTAFTYPFGIISKESFPVVHTMGFRASLSCEERINDITRDPESLYLLGRFLRAPGKTSESFFAGRLK